MSIAPDFLTYDGSVTEGIAPYRPGANDVGGFAKVDDQNEPPNPITMATAAEYNEMGMLLVALAKVTGAAVLYVSNAGAPAISSLRAAGSLIAISDFTVVDHGAGDTELLCPSSKIMAALACLPVPQAAGDLRASGRVTVSGGVNGIRIETRNGSGTLVDCDFFVIWM